MAHYTCNLTVIAAYVKNLEEYNFPAPQTQK